MMRAVEPAEIQAILDVTDRLGIHRERVAIPLGARPGGRLRRMPGGGLEIVVDSDAPFEAWVSSLEARIREAAPDLAAFSPAATPGRGDTSRGPGR